MTIGERIKARRIELGLTQGELAIRMGYKSKSAICKAETVESNPTMDRVREFAKALNCPPSYLMGWANIDGTPLANYAFDYYLGQISHGKHPMVAAIIEITQRLDDNCLSLLLDYAKRLELSEKQMEHESTTGALRNEYEVNQSNYEYHESEQREFEY